MKNLLISLSLVLGMSSGIYSQTYLHPQLGVQNTYLGSCLVSTCTGTYHDNGGSGGNYAANINAIYRTFCPNTAGMCVRATFTSFSMNDTYFLCFGPNSCCDYLQILNGPAQNSPALYNNCTVSPGTITASNPSGCLTFRHTTDGSVQLAGWTCTLSCVACGGGPAGNTNSDCNFATPVCSNSAFNDASNGPGITAEGCSGCNTSEVYTNWYRIQIATSGTLAFTIDPNNNSDDFDPVVYGPNTTCAALGSPIRCSYAAAAGNGNTGLGNGAADPSEDVLGDQWVSQLNVTAGQTYYVLINGWSATAGSNGFQMNWTGTAGLSCSILPVEIASFTGEYVPDFHANEMVIQTAIESNLDKMVVERLSPNGQWADIHELESNGPQSMYIFYDARPMPGINRYRVRSIDINGEVYYSDQIEVLTPLKEVFYLYPNPTSGLLNIEIAGGKQNRIDVINPAGQIVLTREINAADAVVVETLDVSSLAPGVYFVKCGDQQVRFSKQ
jgi:hypothetical protein